MFTFLRSPPLLRSLRLIKRTQHSSLTRPIRGKQFKSGPSIRSMSSESSEFPNTLEEFGYGFNADGRLKKLDPDTKELTDSGFEFNVTPNSNYNQRRYQALGEIITRKIYELLKDEGLTEVPVPSDSTEGSFIFASSNADTAEKLMVIIHGSGVVRAGQWARSLIINDSIESGTQVPYIRRALELGFGVYVLNTNDNARLVNGEEVPIKGSSSPQEHANTAWRDYILNSKAQKIAIVAHSFGGVVTMSLASTFEEDFLKRVFAIALTDSVHGKIPRAVSSTLADHLAKVGRNWVSSEHPIGTPLPEQAGEIQCVSAGTPKHELTSWSCQQALFKFVEECFDQRMVIARDDL